MARRNSAVVAEADIVDDYAPPKAKGRTGQARWSERGMNARGAERAPARPWVAPEGYTPAKPVKPPERNWPPMAAIYDEIPPYSLDGPTKRA